MVCFLQSVLKNLILPVSDEFVGPSRISRNCHVVSLCWGPPWHLARCAHTWVGRQDMRCIGVWVPARATGPFNAMAETYVEDLFVASRS